MSETAVLDSTLIKFTNESEGVTGSFSFASTGGANPKLMEGDQPTDLSIWTVNPSSNNVYYEDSVSGCNAANGCGRDFSASSVWFPKYYRAVAISTDSKAVDASIVLAHANVPSGMVYIDKLTQYEELGNESHSWEKFSFAIDKFEATVTGTLNCSSFPCTGVASSSSQTGAPTGNVSWYSMKQACFSRDSSTHEEPSNDARNIRLATGLEWVVAAHGTPDPGASEPCHVDNIPSSVVLPDSVDATENNQNCKSTYGVRNMVGNIQEWTDELLSSRRMYRFVEGETGSEKIAFTHFSDTANSITSVKDWDPRTALPLFSSRTGPWTTSSDGAQKNWTTLQNTPTGSYANAARRGGAWDSGTEAGLFAYDISLPPGTQDSKTGGRCAISSPIPGRFIVKNTSEGDKAQFMWRLWGNEENLIVRIAFAKAGTGEPRQHIDAWNGGSIGSSLADDLYTIENFTGCTVSSFNSEEMETAGGGATTSGIMGLQGRCGVSLSSIAPWEKRYVKMYAVNSFGNHFSDTFLIARVPSGMVFVGADDWPDPSLHYTAKNYSEQYTTKFDFAIDKYESSAIGTVDECNSNDFPCTGSMGGGYLTSVEAVPTDDLDFYGAKQGCENRTVILNAENSAWVDIGASIGSSAGRRVHLATGKEWVVTSFETPVSPSADFCNLSSSFWNPGTNATNNPYCESRYGARNLPGNILEFTNDYFNTGIAKNFWTSGDPGVDIGLTGGWYPGDNYITNFDFDLAVPTSSTTTKADSFYTSDRVNIHSFSSLSNLGEDRAPWRGGDYEDHSEGGRFYFQMEVRATSTNPAARCALRAP